MPESNKILFVCVENAGRSQMAEAFFKKYATKFEAASAGTKPASDVHPVVLQVMKEVGIDLSSSIPKSFSNDMIKNSTKTVNMGCIDNNACPALFVKDVLDWAIDDPKNKSIENVRQIRDQIESKVKQLVEQLES